jgi:hypothetical protein
VMPATARRPEEGIRPPAADASPLSPLPPHAQALSLSLCFSSPRARPNPSSPAIASPRR